MFMFILISIVHFLVLYSTIAYYCINMGLYKSVNLYIFIFALLILLLNEHVATPTINVLLYTAQYLGNCANI